MIRRVVLIGMVLLMLCLYIQPGFAGLSNTDVVKNITDQSVAGKSPGNSTVQDILITVTPTVRPASVLTPTQELSPSIPLSKNQTAATQGTPGSSCSSCEFIEKYPLMHFTPAQLSAEQAQFDAAPKYSAPLHVLTRNGNLPMGSKSLLSYLPYTPSERAQGVCGNCWVWASTGALEIDHAVKTGI